MARNLIPVINKLQQRQNCIRYSLNKVYKSYFTRIILAEPTLAAQRWAIICEFNTQPKKYSQSQENTIDKEEVEKFASLSDTWWDESGPLKALHTLNELRIPLVRDCLLKTVRLNNEQIKESKSLQGYKILDVGCGGGILSEPLARLGAEVTGIDASTENTDAATWHSHFDTEVEKHTRYLPITVENLAKEEKELYDGVVASEIIEHVANPDIFVKACCDLVKPGGSLFFTTINKTWLSWALAVVAAEKILKIVPEGAHDWQKFVSKDDLVHMLSQCNCEVRLVHGMTMNPCTLNWQWISDTSVNYAIHAVKTSESDKSQSDSDSSSSDSD